MATDLASAHNCNGTLYEWERLVLTLTMMLQREPYTCVQARIARPFSVWRIEQVAGGGGAPTQQWVLSVYSGGQRSTHRIDSVAHLRSTVQRMVLDSFLDTLAVEQCGQSSLVVPHNQIVRNQQVACDRVQSNSYRVLQ